MSWSEDTRCLYCEGRLPLYRKITHGQFCSSAHRKAYWQEQERLAVERLHQTHSSLRSYRSVVQEEARQEALPQSPPYPEREPAAVVHVALPALETDPTPSFDVSLYPIPHASEPPLAASALLDLLAPDFPGVGGNSPELFAADPFEYEFTLQPLPPSHRSSGLETNPFPEGSPASVWSYLPPPTPQSSIAQSVRGESSASQDSEVAFCHPRSQDPVAGMRAAGCVDLPLASPFGAQSAATTTGSSQQVLDMEPVPVTSVELNVALQSDVLLQLLDQQVPHPDQLYTLHPFVAQQPAWKLAYSPSQQIERAAQTALPAAASVLDRDYRLSGAGMLPLRAEVAAAQGKVLGRIAISEIAGKAQTEISATVMPTVAAVAHRIETAGLESLRASLLRPAQGAFAPRTAASAALDLSSGVSSDIKFPDLDPHAGAPTLPGVSRILPLTFAKKRKPAKDAPRPESSSRVLPLAVETHPVVPQSGLEPLDHKPPTDALRAPESVIGSLIPEGGLQKLEPAWAHAAGFWHHAPRDLKLLLFAIPVLLALVFHPGLPRIAFAAPQSKGLTGGFTSALNTKWVNVRQTLENRAAVALDEDFRSGLDNWASPGGSTTEWSFDETGFVRPGPLALYRPSVNLTDYHVEFLGLIDKKALSWVARAADFDNFYVMKLEIVKSGPMPTIGLTRYAVIDGKAQDRHDVNIPLDARVDTVYNVRMDVQGSEFSVEVQGQIADSWTETRLPRGGIGFFTASGEASRLRWMQITHQYDMLGRLCAYLAPYDTTNGSWQP